ncbi:hypothetical protein F4703DRAFT_1727425 [Phycomyces blakesleeanus]|uniref:PH domain-containing protein n=2 Tax=Phycomyces blakesleeanus TaxID=4837 RepID=A0A167QC60_PHYB8|nr:hypothetical protein PHYBLDRAFT_58504 [Phycomyces blakesleeanus NRRL 1555(-)]OAD79459.1 hypothetical protein PHYBLDRAFT_58504 [Phycomyces blakesleeanus NRRL 1555(-)]|eukprot:XP_018297499.1 hypothetical protein PHYBLDRAFT_58504 [Phycomyces blakesleeanus NRRL 1555(-)]
MPWQRKKSAQWPFVLNKLRFYSQSSHSSVSIPISVASEQVEPGAEAPSEQPKDDNIDLEPPHYDDPIHPWTSIFPAYLSQRTVEPREEEGREVLPEYECTIFKMGFVRVKREMERPKVESKDRAWKKLYLVLWGTTIHAYKIEPYEGMKPVWSYSMQLAEAGSAPDYLKYRNVFRLRVSNGPQMLIRSSLEEEQVLWIEHLQASANVSPDLDVRPMPRFITLTTRRRRGRAARTAGQSEPVEASLI